MKTWPTNGATLRKWLRRHNLTSRDAGAMLQLRDPDARAVRNWCNDRAQMPFSAWFTLRTLVDGKPPKYKGDNK